MEEKRRRHFGCLGMFLVLASLVAIAAVITVLGAMALGRGPSLSSHKHMGEDEFPPMKEVWAEGQGEAKVVRISLRGMIQLGEDGSFFGPVPNPTAHVLKSIRRAKNDPDVRGIILEVDSGGGGITASDILYKELLDFRDAQSGRKIVAIFGDVAASGAYYVSLAADHIIARPTSITGSIGVLISTINVRELGQKIGIKDVTVKSGANKDLLNPFQDLTEEQRALLQSIIDELHARFVGLVEERRELPTDKVLAIADGRVLTAFRASVIGLVDEIGYRNTAVLRMEELLGEEALKVFRYEEQFSFSTLIRSFQGFNPSALLRGGSTPQIMYLWQWP